MSRFRTALLAALAVTGGAAMVSAASPAEARTFVSVGIGVPLVAPAPVYAAPVYAPYPVYAPAPYYYGYGPTVWFGHGWRGGWHHDWHR